MSIEGLIVALGMLALCLLYLALPFLRLRRSSGMVEQINQQKQREVLLNAYERVLSTIRDLDDDFNTGKLAEDVYQTERAQWSERGVALLQALEQADTSKTVKAKAAGKSANGKAAPTDAPADKALDDAVEQAIANYIKAKSGSGG